MDLLERVYNTQFRSLFTAPVLYFPGTIVHHMMMRRVCSNSKEITFMVNGHELIFGKLIKDDFDEDESEHEECTPKPAPRKRKGEATLKEAVNLKRKLAYESSSAHISSPPIVTSSPRAPTPSVKDSMDVKVEEKEKSKVDQKEEKTEVADVKVVVEDDEKMNAVKVDDVKDVVKVDVVEDDVKLYVMEDDVKVDDVKMDNVDDLKVKVKDEESVDVKVKDVMIQQGIENNKKKKVEDDNDDFKLYNTPPKGKFGRRVRKPKTDDSYTNLSLLKLPMKNDPMKVNPLQKFEDELLDKVKEWLNDPKTNDVKKDVVTYKVGKDMFVKVQTRLTWLEDTEIDAFCHLLQKRIAEYPKTYKNSKVAIGDCVLADRLRREHMTFSKDRTNYPVEEFKDYYMGVEHRYMPEWSTIDDIYVPVNISQKHCILCVARLQKNRIDVYDCDAYINKNLDPYLKLCEMIPNVFIKTVTKGEMKRYHHFNFQAPIQAMTYKRVPHPKVKTATAKVREVPRATERGDCGVFTLMYMEYLTANQGLHNVTSENMEFWRQKMAVRLFHQIIEP
ncbi:uncharacterized protein LOC124943323 [Impatiens glandulifera]|uniref:uncharacterized protein LOC124943323 n=1 Tax=Impatiens glandulifera TaxID=253017 RepID=UPI001FB19168|nr:uncharacterized protein LOC124943323 [Impatiens glandulifera]